MKPFEKDICQLLSAEGINYRFDPEKHTLISAEIKIRFKSIEIDPKDADEEQDDYIHLWEDIYQHRKNQVISRLRSLLGLNKRLHGRQTSIKSIGKQQYSEFLNQHHLMGTTGARYKLGLFYKDELVAVAGFGRECPIDHEGCKYISSELIRFCNKSDVTVVGGLSKLINHFIGTRKVEHLMTYVDREWSEGKIYRKLGFILVQTTDPQQFLLSPENGQRYRPSELKSEDSDHHNWPKLSNLGNNKYIRIIK